MVLRVHRWFFSIRSLIAAQLTIVEVKHRHVESFLVIKVISGILASSWRMFAAEVKSFLAYSLRPSRPYFMRAAHVPAITAPDRDPWVVGVPYIPPCQSEMA